VISAGSNVETDVRWKCESAATGRFPVAAYNRVTIRLIWMLDIRVRDLGIRVIEELERQGRHAKR
jgi:hypothetical protein